MSVITSHNHTLYGRNGIVLRPMTDGDLLYLCRWNSDLEVLYWSEGDDVTEPYDRETVEMIYGSVSKNAQCFIVEENGVPVGECWLQKMNIPPLLEKYPQGTRVSRVDYCIGEKAYWGQGIGTEMLRLLLEFAFRQAECDVVYALPYDYNLRSIHMLERAGMTLEEKIPVSHSGKARYELHYKLLRDAYVSKTIKTQKEGNQL